MTCRPLYYLPGNIQSLRNFDIERDVIISSWLINRWGSVLINPWQIAISGHGSDSLWIYSYISKQKFVLHRKLKE